MRVEVVSLGSRFTRCAWGMSLALAMLLQLPCLASAQAPPPHTIGYTLNKYAQDLPRPGVLQPKNKWAGGSYYEVTMKELFHDFHPNVTHVKLWGYEGSYPGPSLEVRKNEQVSVKWINGLPSPDEHLLPLPAASEFYGCDPMLNSGMCQPVNRTVVHLHGGNVPWLSDGFPTQVFTTGGFKQDLYPNNQDAATLWYHDHAMGITRLNVMAGMAGFYLLRDSVEDRLALPKGEYEIPIALQDRSFDGDALLGYKLFYPDFFKPEFFGDVAVINGKAWPKLDVEPRKYRLRLLNGSNSRFYNLRLVGVSPDANGVLQANWDISGPDIYQIGSDGGLLPAPAKVTQPEPDPNTPGRQLLIAPGQRIDVVIDFSQCPNPSGSGVNACLGTDWVLVNNAEAPFGGGLLPRDIAYGDQFGILEGEPVLPEIMRFDVSKPLNTSIPNLALPASLRPFTPYKESQVSKIRKIDMTEQEDARRFSNNQLRNPNGLLLLLNGKEFIVNNDGSYQPQPDFENDPSRLYTTEKWQFFNTTADYHPMHMHLVRFHLLRRSPLALNPDGSVARDVNGDPIIDTSLPSQSPQPYELGWRDTIETPPGFVTEVIASFVDYPGSYVYHCHILEHEDNDMMRQYNVVTPWRMK